MTCHDLYGRATICCRSRPLGLRAIIGQKCNSGEGTHEQLPNCVRPGRQEAACSHRRSKAYIPDPMRAMVKYLYTVQDAENSAESPTNRPSHPRLYRQRPAGLDRRRGQGAAQARVGPAALASHTPFVSVKKSLHKMESRREPPSDRACARCLRRRRVPLREHILPAFPPHASRLCLVATYLVYSKVEE